MKMFMSNLGQNTVRLVSAVLSEQPIEPEQWYRPYAPTLTDNIMGQFANMADRPLLRAYDYGNEHTVKTPFTSEALANVGGQMFAGSAGPVSRISIANGWDTRRFSISMHFETTGPTGIFHEYIVGYTDHCGATRSGVLDPNMNIWLNTYIRIRMHVQHTPMGVKHIPRIEANEQILSRANVGPSGIGNGHDTYNMRAKETLRTITMMLQGISLSDGYSNNVNQQKPILVARENNNPAAYLSSLMNAYNQAENTAMYDQSLALNVVGDGSATEFAMASEKIREDNINLASIFREFDQIGGFFQSGCLRMGDVLTRWPDYNDNVYRVSWIRHGDINDLSSGVASWGAVYPRGESRVAFALTHVVPGLMSKRAIGFFSFTLSNMNHTGLPALGIHQQHALFDGLDLPELAVLFHEEITREVHELVLGILGGAGIYTITMSTNALGSSQISVDLGDKMIPFSAPNYCDVLTSPIIAANRDMVGNMATDINNVVTTVFGAQETARETFGHVNFN